MNNFEKKDRYRSRFYIESFRSHTTLIEHPGYRDTT